MYYEGNGVKQNYKESRKWFNLSRKKGATAAYTYLGEMFMYGKGVRKSYKKAFTYWKIAADKGFVGAISSIG